MKHDELWKDLLHDALPPGANDDALTAMRSAGRRRRSRRRAIRAGGAAAGLLAAFSTALLCLRSDPPPVLTSVPANQNAPTEFKTHELTEAELVARLDQAGFGIVIATENESRRLLLVSHAGAVNLP